MIDCGECKVAKSGAEFFRDGFHKAPARGDHHLATAEKKPLSEECPREQNERVGRWVRRLLTASLWGSGVSELSKNCRKTAYT